MSKLSELFEKNRQWVEQIREKNPGFFKELSEGQSPDYLWIGCSDSRVPATQVVDLEPGDMFVHRNVANVVLHSDLNFQSVLQYSVEALKVKHIIVCGHYGCGGVTAAYENQDLGLLNNWLQNIKDVIADNRDEVDGIKSEKEKINRLCEINVHAQVMNVCRSPFVQQAWKNGQGLSVHGLIYDLETGLLKDLDLCISSAGEVSSVYRV